MPNGFVLCREHVLLLQAVGEADWDRILDGIKRPFGNSDIGGDVADIIGLPEPADPDDYDAQEARREAGMDMYREVAQAIPAAFAMLNPDDFPARREDRGSPCPVHHAPVVVGAICTCVGPCIMCGEPITDGHVHHAVWPDLSRPLEGEPPDMLAIASDLHCAWTGACDPLPARERDRLLAIVRARLAHWHDSGGAPWHAYDEAVRAMLVAVIAEYDQKDRDNAS
jgi:hypothetical protein